MIGKIVTHIILIRIILRATFEQTCDWSQLSALLSWGFHLIWCRFSLTKDWLIGYSSQLCTKQCCQCWKMKIEPTWALWNSISCLSIRQLRFYNIFLTFHLKYLFLSIVKDQRHFYLICAIRGYMVEWEELGKCSQTAMHSILHSVI